VIDSKTLAERKVFKMPWCDAQGSAADKTSSAAPAAREQDKADKAAPAAAKPAPPGKKASPAPKATKGDAAEDPDAGGQ
jgi:hypothetical protein